MKEPTSTKTADIQPAALPEMIPPQEPQAHLNELPFKGNNPGWPTPNIPFTIKVKILSTIFFLIFTGKNIVINFKIIIILKNIC